MDDGVLRGAVAARTGRRDEACHRRRVDDVARALRDHVRVDGMNAVRDALHVDVEDVVPGVPLVGVDLAADADAGIVEEEIDPAGAAHHRSRGAPRRRSHRAPALATRDQTHSGHARSSSVR